MEKQQIKELIIEHKERFLGRGNLVRRDVQAEVARYLLQREIIVVTGIRRSGKSSLLILLRVQDVTNPWPVGQLPDC
jgi:hypothetical protein